MNDDSRLKFFFSNAAYAKGPSLLIEETARLALIFLSFTLVNADERCCVSQNSPRPRQIPWGKGGGARSESPCGRGVAFRTRLTTACRTVSSFCGTGGNEMPALSRATKSIIGFRARGRGAFLMIYVSRARDELMFGGTGTRAALLYLYFSFCPSPQRLAAVSEEGPGELEIFRR